MITGERKCLSDDNAFCRRVSSIFLNINDPWTFNCRAIFCVSKPFLMTIALMSKIPILCLRRHIRSKPNNYEKDRPFVEIHRKCSPAIPEVRPHVHRHRADVPSSERRDHHRRARRDGCRRSVCRLCRHTYRPCRFTVPGRERGDHRGHAHGRCQCATGLPGDVPPFTGGGYPGGQFGAFIHGDRPWRLQYPYRGVR